MMDEPVHGMCLDMCKKITETNTWSNYHLVSLYFQLFMSRKCQIKKPQNKLLKSEAEKRRACSSIVKHIEWKHDKQNYRGQSAVRGADSEPASSSCLFFVHR